MRDCTCRTHYNVIKLNKVVQSLECNLIKKCGRCVQYVIVLGACRELHVGTYSDILNFSAADETLGDETPSKLKIVKYGKLPR